MFLKTQLKLLKILIMQFKMGAHYILYVGQMLWKMILQLTNIIIKHLDRGFPELTRAPGPFAFSEKKYVKQILNAAGFENIKVEKVYTLISTNDSAEKDGNLLFNIGLAGRLLSEENLSEAELAKIKEKIIEMSQNRKVDGIINYKACLNFVSATK